MLHTQGWSRSRRKTRKRWGSCCFLSGLYSILLQNSEIKSSSCKWEKAPEGPLCCLLLEAASSQLFTHPFSHYNPERKALAERQPATTTKQPFWAGALQAPIHLSLAQGPTANLGFSELLSCWFSQNFYVLNYFWEFCLFSPDWLKSANRLRSCERRSGRGWQQDMKRGTKVRVKLTVFWHSK